MYLFAAEPVTLLDALFDIVVIGGGLVIIFAGLHLSERRRQRRSR
jgi:hypothetical protein